MPSEHTYQPHPEPPALTHPQSQHKSCPSCYALVLVPEFGDPATCPNCREQLLVRVAQSQHPPSRLLIDQDVVFAPRDLPSHLHAPRPSPIAPLHSPAPPPSTVPAPSPPRLESHTEHIRPHSAHTIHLPEAKSNLPVNFHSPSPAPSQTSSPKPHQRPPVAGNASSIPDPLSDITRIRTRMRANRCLYPGATFQGTQKSGRNSYDVTVTIVVCYSIRLSH